MVLSHYHYQTQNRHLKNREKIRSEKKATRYPIYCNDTDKKMHYFEMQNRTADHFAMQHLSILQEEKSLFGLEA
jgi:hypothetical protein